MRIAVVTVPFALTLVLSSAAARPQTGAAAATTNAKTWPGHVQEMEEYLRTAEVVSLENIGTGVTNPKRAHLAPGGPFESMAWKPIRPGIYNGFWESYKSEIAAYEIDKLLGLGMIPPTVERRVKGDLGAAIMWCVPTQSFKQLGGAPTPPPAHLDAWNRQLIRAKMFDNLIANRDPNLGNWLVDPAWNLILIDHSRSLTGVKDRPHQLTRIDAELWDKMKGLTEESLTAAVGQWLGKGEIRAVLERRERMQADIDKLVKEKGEAAVFVR
jgi:hypothetical protein